MTRVCIEKALLLEVDGALVWAADVMGIMGRHAIEYRASAAASKAQAKIADLRGRFKTAICEAETDDKGESSNV